MGPQTVESCINQCPIDYRRKLYGNVALSGGSTTFTHFKERLQRDLQEVVDTRLGSGKMQVNVHGGKKRKNQCYAAWLGGSLFAQEPSFESICKSKQEYDEIGASCMRGATMIRRRRRKEEGWERKHDASHRCGPR